MATAVTFGKAALQVSAVAKQDGAVAVFAESAQEFSDLHRDSPLTSTLLSLIFMNQTIEHLW
jgi:hypothetical protein